MSSYIGRHAQLYDLFYAQKPYSQEGEFVHSCLKSYGKDIRRILELACGTGSHAFALEKCGYTVVATDYSEDMLVRAREKAQVRSSRVDFRLQDMRRLNIPDGPFDAVVSLFDSIGYVLTNEAIKAVLDSINDQLREGGLLVLEFWHAGAFLKYFEPVRVRFFPMDSGQVLRISETQLDRSQALAHVSYTIVELQNDGHYQLMRETQSNRFFQIQEMENFLMGSGFAALKWFAGFKEVEPIDDQTWHVVAVAKKMKA